MLSTLLRWNSPNTFKRMVMCIGDTFAFIFAFGGVAMPARQPLELDGLAANLPQCILSVIKPPLSCAQELCSSGDPNTRNYRHKQSNLIFYVDIIGWGVMKRLTFVVVCDHAREWLGGLPRVRPQSAGRPTVALRKTQESPNFPLLHGEKVLELHAALSHHHRGACCLWRLLWKSCFHLLCDCLNSLMSLSSSLLQAALFSFLVLRPFLIALLSKQQPTWQMCLHFSALLWKTELEEFYQPCSKKESRSVFNQEGHRLRPSSSVDSLNTP